MRVGHGWSANQVTPKSIQIQQLLLSVSPLKTPGIQWYHFWTKRRVQERSPWIFRRSSVLTFGRPSKCVGFEKRLLRTWAPPWPSAFSATEIHSSPYPKVSRGALRCHNASDGVHMLSCDMLQHLQLFAADPGYAILGKPLGRPGFP